MSKKVWVGSISTVFRFLIESKCDRDKEAVEECGCGTCGLSVFCPERWFSLCAIPNMVMVHPFAIFKVKGIEHNLVDGLIQHGSGFVIDVDSFVEEEENDSKWMSKYQEKHSVVPNTHHLGNRHAASA